MSGADHPVMWNQSPEKRNPHLKTYSVCARINYSALIRAQFRELEFRAFIRFTPQVVSPDFLRAVMLKSISLNRTVTNNSTTFIPVTILTLKLLMSYIYIYMERIFLMFLDHTQRRSTVGRTPLDE